MTSLDIVLILAGVPAAIMVALGLLTLRTNFTRPRRYRPGDDWSYPPVLWTAHPEAWRASVTDRRHGGGAGGPRGGAHGSW